MQLKRVVIVGAGLMGGSLALALRPLPIHLTIVDKNKETLALADEIADYTTDDLAEGVAQIVAKADVLILATPVQTILRLLADLPAICPDGCMVLDLGSTKGQIGAAMAKLPAQFMALGGHPMCGKETSGFAFADPDLYRDQWFILCRNGRSTPAIEATALGIIDYIGAKPLFLAPDEHDQLVAAISHLPYSIAASLMQTAAQHNDDRLWTISASGFRDTSRVAGTDPTVMGDILLTNRTAVIDQIEQFQTQLDTIKQLLIQQDEAGLRALLAETQQQYHTYRQKKLG